jgi:hypothetical protein
MPRILSPTDTYAEYFWYAKVFVHAFANGLVSNTLSDKIQALLSTEVENNITDKLIEITSLINQFIQNAGDIQSITKYWVVELFTTPLINYMYTFLGLDSSSSPFPVNQGPFGPLSSPASPPGGGGSGEGGGGGGGGSA